MLAFLFLNTGRSSNLMKSSEWLPATAGKDIVCSFESEESRASDGEIFWFYLFFISVFFFHTQEGLSFLTN